MTTMTIKTNNVPRPLLSFYELTEKEKCEALPLCSYTDIELEEAKESFKGFRFKGELYNLDDFPVLPESSEEKKLGWDAAMGTSYFSAILVKLCDSDFDSVIVGQMFC